MRDAAFLAAMLVLLPLAAARPFVGVLTWCWLSFLNPHRLVYGVAADLPWAALMFCTTLFGCLVSGEPRRPTLNAITLLVLALMAGFTVTSVTALAPAAVVWDKWRLVEKMMLGLLLTSAMLTDRRRLHALLWVMVLSLGYFGVRGGLFSLLTGGSYRVYGPEQTVIEDNNHLAAALLVTLPLMNYLRQQSRYAVTRWALAGAMVLTLLAVLGSYSRGALLGLAAVTAIMWLRGRRKVTSGIVLAVCIGCGVAFMPDSWTDRMDTIGTYQEDASATDRLTMWDTAWKLALSRPLVGSGFMGPYTQDVVDTVAIGAPARAVHSIWFELLGEHGFPCFLLWLGGTVAGLAYSMRLIRLGRSGPNLAWAEELGRMAQAAIIAFLVSGTFLSLSYWDFYWTFLVALGAAHALAAQTARDHVPAHQPRPALKVPALAGATI